MGSPFSKTRQSTENTQREEELSKINNDLQEKINTLEKELRTMTDILKEEQLSYKSTFGMEQLSLTSPESTENTEQEDSPNQVSNQISSHSDTSDDQSSIHHTDNYQHNALDKSLSQIDELIAAYVAQNPNLAGMELDYNKIVTRPVRKLINENQKLKQEKQVLIYQNAEKVRQLQMEKVTIKGYYQNVRGLRTKLTKLKCNIQRLNYDFFALTETWLNDSFSVLDFSGYTIFRIDRCSNTSLHSRGGGVAIFVKNNSFVSALKICDPCDNVEQVFVEVKLNSYEKIVLGACYIPPNSPSDVYSSHIKSIETLLSKYSNNIKFLVMGDYNLPHVHMFSNSDGLLQLFEGKKPATRNRLLVVKCHDILFQFFTLKKFGQYNSFLNTSNSLLDLVFSNMRNIHVSLIKNDFLVPVDHYHPPLLVKFEYKTNNTVFDSLTTDSYNFRRENYSETID